MSQVIEGIVSAAEAQVEEQKNEIILTNLNAAKQSAQDRLANVQSELDEITSEIASRTPVADPAPEVPAEG
jgi:hypothetical protein